MRPSELEKQILGCIVANQNLASGYEIQGKMSELLGREIAFGAIYACIEKLKGKGFIDYVVKEGSEERGRRPQRFFFVNGVGRAILEQAIDVDVSFGLTVRKSLT